MSDKTNRVSFIVELIAEKTYKGSGATILSALQKIKLKDKPKKPTRIRVTEVIGTKKKAVDLPISLNPTKLERILAKPYELELFAKRINTLR